MSTLFMDETKIGRPPGRSLGGTLMAFVDNTARTTVCCNKGPNDASRKGAIQL